jgi:hypothetical protein
MMPQSLTPFPLDFKQFQGTWAVESDPHPNQKTQGSHLLLPLVKDNCLFCAS